MAKRALVTGVTGQDGAYLARHLLGLGYKVYGAHRRTASTDFGRLSELGIADEVERVAFDLLEESNILRTIDRISPDEIYNLAAQSFVSLSFEQPTYTADADALGVARILESIRFLAPNIRFYQASTSEMFGMAAEMPQNENTPFHPRSPYGVAKLFGHWITVNYREAHGMHCSSGILFNHESPLRGLEFATRKITATLALVKYGLRPHLELGNMMARRDWGYAADYVDAMWRMLQQPTPDDYVVATGETHSVREFVEIAAEAAGFQLEFEGSADAVCGIDRASGQTILKTNTALYRPAEVDFLLGDATKAQRVLGWKPSVGFRELVQMMIESDLRKAADGALRL